LSSTGELSLQSSTWLKTKDAQSFGGLLEQLKVSEFNLPVEKADICVFAIAGPVERGTFSQPPLIPWSVDLSGGGEQFGIRRFALINDFLAQAFSCLSHIGASAQKILSGVSEKTAAIAVVGAGTGLGKAILLPDGTGGYVGGPSEGGHTNFCAETDKEFEFQKMFIPRLGGDYLTFNDVVCGRGLSYIHEFLTGAKLPPQEVAATFDKDSETLKWAAKFYGRVCRNFALETLAYGGMYIAGGVAAKNPVLIQHAEFERSFRNSYAHRRVLEKIPVFLIDNEESGLWGAASFGAQELMRGKS
jgi:glucokinase